MKDLDFDELDRAVNSLITNKPSSNNGVNTGKKIFDVSAVPSRTPIDSHFSAPARPVVAPSANTAATNPIGGSLAGRRSTGRFMDVVRPSSDMRTSLVMPKRTSREGTTINPPHIAKSDIQPVVTPNASTTPSSASLTDTPTNSNWPDPIEFNNAKNSPEPASKEDPDEYDDIDKINDDIDDTINRMGVEPQESPFLSGAKVEKRPLGAFSNDQSSSASGVSTATSASLPGKLDNNNLNSFAEPTNNETSFPDELQDDLLLIESGAAANPDTLNTVNKPLNAAKTDGPTSISQQYQEQPSTGDRNSGAIYDTDSYHKAVLKPTKKNSSWLWILWIFILLIVGAGAGVAVYFWVLPLL